VLLATSGGVTEAGPAVHPYFFSGFLTDPGAAALGMLACAAVARSRYFTPGNVVAILRDPVVTSHEDRLRFGDQGPAAAQRGLGRGGRGHARGLGHRAEGGIA
jgi:hypothetical protein